MSVSDVVKKTFDLQYPNAKEVDWTGGLDNDVVQFRLEDKKLKASYTKRAAGIGQKLMLRLVIFQSKYRKALKIVNTKIGRLKIVLK